MSRQTVLLLSLSGADAPAIARGLARLGWAPKAPQTLEVDFAKRKASADWLEAALAQARTFTAMTDDGHSMTFDRAGLVTLRAPDFEIDAPQTFEQLADVPFELAVIGQVYAQWWDEDYVGVSFGDGHVQHGWACAFRGAGRQRLVSPRWLDFGPWRTHEVNDATWVEFHPLDADPAAALALAEPAWQRMGISDGGGFVQTGFVYQEDVGGVYDAAEKKLKVMVPGSSEVSPRRMLEIAAIRRDPRLPPSQDILHTAFVFVDPANAHRHLRELWLRGHECWTIVDGQPQRLDADYDPSPRRPGDAG